MALRTSIGSVELGGRLRCAALSKAKRRIGEGQVLEIEGAHGAPESRPFGSARTTWTVSWPAAFSAPGDGERRCALGPDRR